MLSLIMLGIIPGTNIQITFEAWLVAMLVFVAATAALITFRRRTVLLPVAANVVRQATQNLRATVRPA